MSITQPNSFGRSLPSSTIPNSRSLSRNPPTTSFSQPKPDPVGFNYEYVRDPDGFLSNALRSLYDTGIEKACPSLASMLDRHKQNYDNESNYLNQALSLKLTDNERDQTFVTLETNRCEALYKTIETLRSGIKNGDVVKCLDPAQLEALTGTRDKLKMMSKFNPEPSSDAKSIALAFDAFISDLDQKDSTIWHKDLGIIPPIIPTSINYSIQATKNGIEHSINAARWGKSRYDSARSTLGGWCETAAETAGSVLDTAASVVGGATSVVTGTASVLGGVASSTGGLLASGVAGGYRSTANALDWLRSATVGDSKSAATTGYTGPSPLARALLNQYSNPQSQRTGGFGVASYSSPLLMA